MVCQIKTRIKRKKKKIEIKTKFPATIYQINIQIKNWLQLIKIFKTIAFLMKINVFQFIIKSWKKYFNAIITTKESIELIRKFKAYVKKIKI